jgi:hypothetical protein
LPSDVMAVTLLSKAQNLRPKKERKWSARERKRKAHKTCAQLWVHSEFSL